MPITWKSLASSHMASIRLAGQKHWTLSTRPNPRLLASREFPRDFFFSNMGFSEFVQKIFSPHYSAISRPNPACFMLLKERCALGEKQRGFEKKKKRIAESDFKLRWHRMAWTLADNCKFTLYVPIIAILDIWKTTLFYEGESVVYDGFKYVWPVKS